MESWYNLCCLRQGAFASKTDEGRIRALSKQIYRILVMEDELSICQVLATELTPQEITVDTVENGEEAEKDA